MHIFLLILFGLGFSVFFIPVPVYGVFNVGNISGMLLFGAAFLLVLCRKRLKKAWKTPAGKALLSILCVCLILGTAAAGFAGAKIIQTAKALPPEDAPCIVVVLGCRVYDSGPSRMLIARVNAAAAYLQEHPDALCVVSGGQGEDEPMSEAQCMYDMLLSRGIAAERVLIEDLSCSTRENLEYSLRIIKEKGLPQRLALVTNEYHACRACMVARQMGSEAYAVSAPSQKILLPTYFVREIFGVLWETARSL